MIVYNKAAVNPADVATYESLADPKNKGKVCTRSGSHPYNLSLVARADRAQRRSEDRGLGEGVVANMARTPRGGDTDQIKAVAAGECAVALSNTYYYARLLRSAKPEEREWAAKTGVVWPDQASYGTHVNIAGAGVLKNAPHRENAIRFLEYLASDEAQAYFADGNNEWPAVKGAVAKNPELESLGDVQGRPAADRHARQEHAGGAEAARPRRLEVTRRAASARQRDDRPRPSGAGACRPAAVPAPHRARQDQQRQHADRDDRERRQRGLGEPLVLAPACRSAWPACRN